VQHGHSCGGFLTTKAGKGIIITNIQTGGKELLAGLSDTCNGPHTGRYFFTRAGIDFGISAINDGSFCEILCIDEIGYLELRGEGFVKVLELLGAGKVANSILVIRKQLLPSFLPRLDPGSIIIEVTAHNRDELPQEIFTLLKLETDISQQSRP